MYSYKHGESAWTLYYQSIYLPQVFKIDKRRAHLTNLIISNDITRSEAMDRPEPLLDSDTKKELAHLISTKLNIPYEHALNPELFVKKGMHEDFSNSKSIIDDYSNRYWNAETISKEDVFNNYMNIYNKSSGHDNHR